MTTTRVIRREVEDTSDPNVSPSSKTQSGSGNSFSSDTVNLTNSSPSSKTLKAAFSQDFRTQDDLYNIPADRCIVRYKCRPDMVPSTISGGLGVNFDIDYTVGSIFGGGTTNKTFLGSPNLGLTDLNQTGSAVTTVTANQNDIVESDCFITCQIDTSNSNSNGLHDVTLKLFDIQLKANTGSAGSLNRKWEADNHVIDGLNGDDDPDLQTTSTLTATGTVLRFAESDVTATHSITEDSVNLKLADATLTSTATISATILYKSDTTKTLATTTEFLASTDNLVRLDVESYSTTSSISITPLFKTDVSLAPDAATTSTQTASAIYDIGGDYTWDTINAIAIESEERWEEKDSWETWTNNTWGVLEAWDEWDQNSWARAYTLISTFTQNSVITFKSNAEVDATASATISILGALEEAAEASLSSAFTIEPTASGVLEGRANLSGAFSPTLSDTVIFDQPSVVSITGAFTPVLTANAVFDQDFVVSSTFGIAITPTHRRGPFQLTLASEFTQPDTVPLRKLGPYQLVLNAFASKLTTAKLFYQADPFNIITVPAETRVAVLPAETRISTIDQENRVNKVTADTRTYLVDQETRRFKLKVAPISNRFSTPKQRAEA